MGTIEEQKAVLSFGGIYPDDYLNYDIQKKYQNSVILAHEGDKDYMREHSEVICESFFGCSTKEIRDWGKKTGLKAPARNSARKIALNLYPDVMACISLVDNLVRNYDFRVEFACAMVKEHAWPKFKELTAGFEYDRTKFKFIDKEEIEKMRPK